MKKILLQVGWSLWFFWGLCLLIWSMINYENLSIWVFTLSMMPIIFWATFTFQWIDSKIKQPKHPGLRYTKGGYWYDMYTGKQLGPVEIEGLRPERIIYDEWISGDSSRDSSEDSAGAEREPGVSSTRSHDIPESRPEDGKA